MKRLNLRGDIGCVDRVVSDNGRDGRGIARDDRIDFCHDIRSGVSVDADLGDDGRRDLGVDHSARLADRERFDLLGSEGRWFVLYDGLGGFDRNGLHLDR